MKERSVKGRRVIRSLARIMRGRNVSMEVKRSLKNSIPLPTLTYGSETWMWKRTHQSRMRAVEISYLSGVCEMTRWAGESNESMYVRCSMESHANCAIVE